MMMMFSSVRSGARSESLNSIRLDERPETKRRGSSVRLAAALGDRRVGQGLGWHARLGPAPRLGAAARAGPAP